MEDKSKFILEIVINCLRLVSSFEGMSVAEIEGRKFLAADISLRDSQVYRIAIIKHKRQ